MNGHSIECRVYAEDPDENFMPSPGRILRLRVPSGPGVRDDGGVYEGGEVSIYYDPMISKFAVHGKDRTEAIERMRRALAEYRVDGIKTTLQFFRDVMEDPDFVAGNLDTSFISGFFERQAIVEDHLDSADLEIIAASLALVKNVGKAAAESSTAPSPSKWAISARSAQLNSKP